MVSYSVKLTLCFLPSKATTMMYFPKITKSAHCSVCKTPGTHTLYNMSIIINGSPHFRMVVGGPQPIYNGILIYHYPIINNIN